MDLNVRAPASEQIGEDRTVKFRLSDQEDQAGHAGYKALAAALPTTMTVPEVARELRVVKSTVWKMVATGELESIIVGERCRRVTRDAFLRYLESRRPEAGVER